MALAATGLRTAIWNNNIRSLILVALYPLTLCALAWLAAAAGGLLFVASQSSLDSIPWPAAVATGNAIVAAYWPLIITVAALWLTIAYFFHTHMMRALSHARPVTRSEEPDLYNLLENLCIARGITVPQIEIIETDAMNAFASGINDKSYAITVTRGLLSTLKKDELEAVLGHELTHIMNGDVRLLIVSIIFTGMIGFLCQMVWSSLRHGLYRAGRSRDRNRQDVRLLLFIIVIGVILWIGYLATMFTRFALSRRREFMADAGSVELTKNPEAMMRALQRISGADAIPGASADVSLMCIENHRRFLGLFATHPPIGDRIRAISAMTGAPVPESRTHVNPWQ